MKNKWKNSTIGRECVVIMGQSPPSSEYNKNGDGLPFYQGKKEFGELNPTPAVWTRYKGKKANKNDVLISVRAPVGDININTENSIIGRGLAAIRFQNFKLLYYYLELKGKELEKQATGSTFSAISKNNLLNFPFSYPESKELQQQIVSEIEKQFTRLDASVKDLKNVKDKLEVYEKSVLNKTYKGNSNWIKSTIGDSIYKIEQVVPQNSEFKELTYIDITSIDNTKQRIVNQNKILSSDAPSRARQLTLVGDIVFSTVRTYLKNIAIIPDIKGTIISSTGFAVLRPKKSVNRDFLFFYLLSDKLLRDINKMQVGTSYPAIRKNDLLDYELRYPESLLEQERIISDVESHFSIIDKLEQTIDSALQQTEQLRKSILKSAFEGNLVKSVC